MVGAQSFKDLAAAAGLRVVASADDNPQAVVQGHNPETGWAQLSEAALAIQRGALYFASNLDSTLPAERGFLVGNGSMVAAVVNATGVSPSSAGKPEPAMFFLAAQSLGSTAPLAVGDRLNTDIAGGVAAGMPCLHVLTGVSKHEALLRATPAEFLMRHAFIPTLPYAPSIGRLIISLPISKINKRPLLCLKGFRHNVVAMMSLLPKHADTLSKTQS